MKIFILFMSACFVGLAYHLYCPCPEGLNEPWKERTLVAILKFARLITKTVELFTGRPHSQTMVWLSEQASALTKVESDELVKVERSVIEGVPVLIYTPTGAKATAQLPGIVYMHGGGWSLFTMDFYHFTTRNMSIETGSVVISVDYRRAPQYTYPVHFDDTLKVVRTVLETGEQFGVDTNRVAVAGDSAGGNLAAAVSLRLAEEDGSLRPKLKLQVLLQPVLQLIDFNTPSYRQNAEDRILTRESVIVFWMDYLLGEPLSAQEIEDVASNRHVSPSIRQWYKQFLKESLLPEEIKVNYVPNTIDTHSHNFNKDLAHKLDAKVSDPFVAPLMAEDVSKVPKAYILVAEFDSLRDDGLFYAHRLREANVTTEVNYIRNEDHGFLFPLMHPEGSQLQKSSVPAVLEHLYAYIKSNL